MHRYGFTSHASFDAGQGVAAILKSARGPGQISVGDGTGCGVTCPGVGIQGLLQVGSTGVIQPRIRDIKGTQSLAEGGHILVEGAPHSGHLAGPHASRMAHSKEHRDGHDGEQDKQDHQGRDSPARG